MINDFLHMFQRDSVHCGCPTVRFIINVGNFIERKIMHFMILPDANIHLVQDVILNNVKLFNHSDDLALFIIQAINAIINIAFNVYVSADRIGHLLLTS